MLCMPNAPFNVSLSPQCNALSFHCRSKQRVLRNRQAATRSKAKKKQQYQVLKDKKTNLESELEQLEAQHAAAEQRVGQLHAENKALLDSCTCPKVQQ